MPLTTHVIPAAQIETAVSALLQGQVVVFPTDTVYGMAALATDPNAVATLFVTKNRPPDMALPVMVADIEHVSAIARPTSLFRTLAQRFWPGPLTLILPKTSVLPDIVTGGRPTVGLRIPDHPVALALLRAVAQPLAVTSANLSGQPPARTATEARAQLAGRVSIIIDGGPAPGGQPSTVLDLTQSPPVILRPGPIAWEDLQQTLS
ncbi:MAG: threonylcarbamoyl-AMP synthase [Chloroflexi bacterium]|nr:threonylcarbamoyl-AMP synthase [Chloroflexota bacterium]